MRLRKGIPYGDHKVGFTIDIDNMAYFGESILPSSHENKNHKTKK